MEVLQPFYYKDFQCVGDKCVNTCCAGWRIDIDKKSFFKYKKINGEFGKKVKGSLKRQRKNVTDTNYGRFNLDEKGRCLLLNEDNLCELYINKGESYLCRTCTIYPREGFIYKDTAERFLSVTCPEVAKKIVFTKEKYSFDIVDELDKEGRYYNNISVINNDLLFNMIYEARNLSIDIVQTDGIPIWKRLIFVEFLEKRIQKLIDNKEIDKYPIVLKEFLEEIQSYITDNSVTKVNTYIKHNIITNILNNNGTLFLEVIEILNGLIKGKEKEESVNILNDKEKEFNEYFKEKEYIYENYIVYNLFSNYMDSFVSKNLHENVVTTILDYAVLKIVLFAYWLRDKELREEDIAKVIWKFSRRMENNKLFLKNLYNWIIDNKLDSPGYLATLIY